MVCYAHFIGNTSINFFQHGLEHLVESEQCRVLNFDFSQGERGLELFVNGKCFQEKTYFAWRSSYMKFLERFRVYKTAAGFSQQLTKNCEHKISRIDGSSVEFGSMPAIVKFQSNLSKGSDDLGNHKSFLTKGSFASKKNEWEILGKKNTTQKIVPFRASPLEGKASESIVPLDSSNTHFYNLLQTKSPTLRYLESTKSRIFDTRLFPQKPTLGSGLFKNCLAKENNLLRSSPLKGPTSPIKLTTKTNLPIDKNQPAFWGMANFGPLGGKDCAFWGIASALEKSLARPQLRQPLYPYGYLPERSSSQKLKGKDFCQQQTTTLLHALSLTHTPYGAGVRDDKIHPLPLWNGNVSPLNFTIPFKINSTTRLSPKGDRFVQNLSTKLVYFPSGLVDNSIGFLPTTFPIDSPLNGTVDFPLRGTVNTFPKGIVNSAIPKALGSNNMRAFTPQLPKPVGNKRSAVEKLKVKGLGSLYPYGVKADKVFFSAPNAFSSSLGGYKSRVSFSKNTLRRNFRQNLEDQRLYTTESAAENSMDLSKCATNATLFFESSDKIRESLHYRPSRYVFNTKRKLLWNSVSGIGLSMAVPFRGKPLTDCSPQSLIVSAIDQRSMKGKSQRKALLAFPQRGLPVGKANSFIDQRSMTGVVETKKKRDLIYSDSLNKGSTSTTTLQQNWPVVFANQASGKYNKFHTLPLFSTFIYKEWSHRFSFLEYFVWSAREDDLALPFYTYRGTYHTARRNSINLVKNKFVLKKTPRDSADKLNNSTRRNLSGSCVDISSIYLIPERGKTKTSSQQFQKHLSPFGGKQSEYESYPIDFVVPFRGKKRNSFAFGESPPRPQLPNSIDSPQSLTVPVIDQRSMKGESQRKGTVNKTVKPLGIGEGGKGSYLVPATYPEKKEDHTKSSDSLIKNCYRILGDTNDMAFTPRASFINAESLHFGPLKGKDQQSPKGKSKVNNALQSPNIANREGQLCWDPTDFSKMPTLWAEIVTPSHPWKTEPPHFLELHTRESTLTLDIKSKILVERAFTFTKPAQKLVSVSRQMEKFFTWESRDSSLQSLTVPSGESQREGKAIPLTVPSYAEMNAFPQGGPGTIHKVNTKSMTSSFSSEALSLPLGGQKSISFVDTSRDLNESIHSSPLLSLESTAIGTIDKVDTNSMKSFHDPRMDETLSPLTLAPYEIGGKGERSPKGESSSTKFKKTERKNVESPDLLATKMNGKLATASQAQRGSEAQDLFQSLPIDSPLKGKVNSALRGSDLLTRSTGQLLPRKGTSFFSLKGTSPMGAKLVGVKDPLTSFARSTNAQRHWTPTGSAGGECNQTPKASQIELEKPIDQLRKVNNAMAFTLNSPEEKDSSLYASVWGKVDDTQQFPRLTELLHFTGGTALRYLLSRFHLVLLGKFLRHELKNLELKVNVLLALKMLTYSQGLLLGKLAKRRSKQIRRLKLLELFQSQKSNPEWMILSVLPVLPPDLRPILRVNDDFVVASDLNRLYQTVLRRNNTIRERLDDPLPCPESGLFRQRSLQKAVDGLLENGKGGGTPLCASKRRPLVSLSHVLKGKKGLFRQHLLGKRVDYSGRSVIVVGPKLNLYECGLPKEMAMELFQPFLIHKLKVKGFATSNTAARRMIQQEDPILWPIVKQLVYEHPVLLNRAPTLHRLGIQAFQPRLVSGRAILLHPLVCNGFNADFDGDQMAVHVPLSFQARAEAWKILWSKNNLLSPATGQPILVPSQDMVLGCYYLSVFIPRVLEFRQSHPITVNDRKAHGAIISSFEQRYPTTLLNSPKGTIGSAVPEAPLAFIGKANDTIKEQALNGTIDFPIDSPLLRYAGTVDGVNTFPKGTVDGVNTFPKGTVDGVNTTVNSAIKGLLSPWDCSVNKIANRKASPKGDRFIGKRFLGEGTIDKVNTLKNDNQFCPGRVGIWNYNGRLLHYLLPFRKKETKSIGFFRSVNVSQLSLNQWHLSPFGGKQSEYESKPPRSKNDVVIKSLGNEPRAAAVFWNRICHPVLNFVSKKINTIYRYNKALSAVQAFTVSPYGGKKRTFTSSLNGTIGSHWPKANETPEGTAIRKNSVHAFAYVSTSDPVGVKIVPLEAQGAIHKVNTRWRDEKMECFYSFWRSTLKNSRIIHPMGYFKKAQRVNLLNDATLLHDMVASQKSSKNSTKSQKYDGTVDKVNRKTLAFIGSRVVSLAQPMKVNSAIKGTADDTMGLLTKSLETKALSVPTELTRTPTPTMNLSFREPLTSIRFVIFPLRYIKFKISTFSYKTSAKPMDQGPYFVTKSSDSMNPLGCFPLKESAGPYGTCKAATMQLFLHCSLIDFVNNTLKFYTIWNCSTFRNDKLATKMKKPFRLAFPERGPDAYNLKRGHYFSSLQDSLMAYSQKRLQTHTPVWVRVDSSNYPEGSLDASNDSVDCLSPHLLGLLSPRPCAADKSLKNVESSQVVLTVPLRGKSTVPLGTCPPSGENKVNRKVLTPYPYGVPTVPGFTKLLQAGPLKGKDVVENSFQLQSWYCSAQQLCKTFFQDNHNKTITEANDSLEAPLELRLSADGNLIKILTTLQNHYNCNATVLDQCKEKSSRYMRTTAGRVVINEALFHFENLKK